MLYNLLLIWQAIHNKAGLYPLYIKVFERLSIKFIIVSVSFCVNILFLRINPHSVEGYFPIFYGI